MIDLEIMMSDAFVAYAVFSDCHCYLEPLAIDMDNLKTSDKKIQKYF